MSKFTPGPWFVVPLPWDDSGMIVTSKSEDPHEGETICRADDGIWHNFADDDIARWQANAKLIAAAPALLFAAKQALMALEEGYDAPKIREDLKAAISAAEPVLSEAEGTEPEQLLSRK